MKRKFRKILSVLCLVSIPLIGFAQAHCRIMVGTVTIVAGNEIHIEYWCCTGPEGCFWDVYAI